MQQEAATLIFGVLDNGKGKSGRSRERDAANEPGTASADRSGWLVGGGLEYAFWRNWSVFVEYSYMEFGTRNLSFSYNCGAGFGFSNPYVLQDKQTLQTVLLSVNWRFGGL